MNQIRSISEKYRDGRITAHELANALLLSIDLNGSRDQLEELNGELVAVLESYVYSHDQNCRATAGRTPSLEQFEYVRQWLERRKHPGL